MPQTIRINDDVTVGPQPSEEELDALPRKGFRSVVNFRTADEKDQPLSPEAEGKRVETLDMQYAHFPIAADALEPKQVDRFRDAYARLPKPVFAHCQKGKRAGAMVMMHLACEKGMTGEQTLEKAKAMGFECDQPDLIEFVKSYVDRCARA